MASTPPRTSGLVRVFRTRPLVVLVTGAVLAVFGASVLVGSWKLGETRVVAPHGGPEVPVTATNRLTQPSNNSPAILADPTEPRFVVIANRLDARDFSCALQVSGDNGKSWVGARPVPELPAGADKCYAPEVAFDRQGVLYYLFVGLHGAGNEPMGAFLTTSSDRARTFSPPRRVLGPLNFGVRMILDPTQGPTERIHLVWLHAGSDPGLGAFGAGPNPIMSAHSDDGGRTFSEPVQVSDPDRPRVVGPAVALSPSGALHVAYYDLQDDARDYLGLEGPTWEGTWSVVVSTSSDGGRRFGPGQVVDDEIAPPERPILIFTMPPPAFVALDGRMCAAWTDGRHGDPDVLVRCSADGGRVWSAPARLNDDEVANGKRQYLPRLSVAPGGRIDAVFLDRRRAATNDFNDTFYTFSSDGGRTFAPNRRLTTEASFANIGAQYVGPSAAGQFEIGGRLGLLSRRSSVMAAWPDTRFSPRGTAQDIIATTLEFPEDGQPGWARLLGGIVLVAGLGAMVAGVRVRRAAKGTTGAPTLSRVDTTAADVAEPSSAPRRRAAPLFAGLTAALATVAVVWAGSGGGTPPAVAPAPEVVEVTLREFRFDYAPPSRAGRTVFRVRNSGRLGHRFGVFPLPEDMPPIDEQLRGDVRRAINPVADVPQRASMAPGETATIAVDLVPGQRYAFLCLLVRGKTELHADLGMNTEFRAGGNDAIPPPTIPSTTAAPTSPASTP